jgi:hypothetical protein
LDWRQPSPMPACHVMSLLEEVTFQNFKKWILGFLENQISGMRCWVSGYGQSTMTGSTTSNIMMFVNLPLVEQNTCQNMLRATRLGSVFVLDTFSFLCAGGESNRDSCQGDGGEFFLII